MTSKAPKRSSDDDLESSSRGGAAAAEKARYNSEILIQPPNVIARLMGIDAIPFPEPPPPAAAAEAKAISPRSAPFRQAKCTRNGRGDSSSSSRCLNKMRVPAGRSSRSRHRHHPQEDLLQKMKQDFQAWQASSSATQPPSLDGSRCIQMIAQENLRRQKMARYAGFSTVADDTEAAAADDKVAFRPLEPQETVITVLKAKSPCALAAASEKFRDLEAGSKDEHDSSSSASDEEEIMLRSTAPIVLLKPASSDVADGRKKSVFGLPKLKRDGSMSRLLEEVKGMLQKELQQVNASSNKGTWATDPIGRDVAKQAIEEETAAKQDGRLSKRLFSRSESFRGFRSDRKRNDEATSTKQASPEHFVTRRNNILARRPLKSVTSSRAGTVSTSPRNKDDEESMSSCSITSRGRFRSLADVSPSGVGFSEQSFRSECLAMSHRDDSSSVSPARGALFRSFSAPESGFFSSLGRLFQFGDATSVRSTRTHEASEDAAALVASKSRSTSFSFIRGTVSSLRRHLFRRRKTHWSKKAASLGVGEIHPQMAIGTTPPSPPETFNLFKVAQANLTELPPSPVSPLEVVGHSCRHFLSDFKCTIPELSPKCLSEFEAQNASDKAYIREVLVAAGLYNDDDDGSLDNNKANGMVDSMARPMCDDIFEEVQDMYYYRGNYCDDAIESAADHRMLFDLANEALQSLVMQGANSLRQWVIDSIGVSRGRRLLDDVWQQVQTLRNPEMQEMQTIDSMVAYEIRKYVWAEVLYQDVYVVGRKIERAIFDQLIEDLLVEVFI